MDRNPHLNSQKNALGSRRLNRAVVPDATAPPDLKLLQVEEIHPPDIPMKKRPRGRPRTNDGDTCCPEYNEHLRHISAYLKSIGHDVHRIKAEIIAERRRTI